MKILFSIIVGLIILLSDNRLSFAKELIAFSRLSGDYWQIWVMDAQGQNRHPITLSPQDKREPTWSLDGQKIAYRTNNGRLFIVHADGTQETGVLTQFQNINNPSWSSAHDDIVFVRFYPTRMDLSDIWTSDIQGKNPLLLTADKKLKYQPAFSKPADKIVFVKADNQSEHHIWLMDADGKNQRPLTSGKGLHMSPAFSPDGKSVVFASNQDRGDYEIYTVDIKDRTLRRITNHAGLDASPSFSADGQRIVFVSTRSGSQQIWAVDRDGSNPVQLTDGPEESLDPAWITIEDKKEITK